MSNNIPTEVLHTIFTYIDDYDDLYQCILINKRWKSFAEPKFYSDVYIDGRDHFDSFALSVENNPHAAQSVKNLQLSIYKFGNEEYFDDQVYKMVSRLPNLQDFNSNCFGGLSKVLNEVRTLDLKMIQEPFYTKDWRDYTDSAIITRKTLEEVLLTDSTKFDDFKKPDVATYQRLFEVLQDFENLVKIDIDLTTMQPISQLESIIQKCSQNSKVLSFKLSADVSGEAVLEEDRFEEDDILNFTPRPDLDILSVFIAGYMHLDKLLLYTHHKFPNPKSVAITLEFPVINDRAVRQLFSCLSANERLSIDIIDLDSWELLDTISSLAQPNRERIFEFVEIDYMDHSILNPHIRLSRDLNLNNVSTVSYSIKRDGLGHRSFVQAFGNEIRVLDFNCDGFSIDPELILSESFDHLLQHCTALTELTVRCYSFKMEEEREGIATKRLRRLVIDNYGVHLRGFERFFQNVSVIESLEFGKSRFYNYDGKTSPFVSLVLPNTHIGLLAINLSDLESLHQEERPRYLFLHTSIRMPNDDREDEEKRQEAVNTYYKYDFETMNDKTFKEMNAKEYHDEGYNSYTHFSLSCKSAHFVCIIYNGVVVKATELSQTWRELTSLEELN